jgi:predicted transcriptional regulator
MLRVTAFEDKILQQLKNGPMTMGQINRALGTERKASSTNALSRLYNQDAIRKKDIIYRLNPKAEWEVIADDIIHKERSTPRILVKTVDRVMTQDELFYIAHHLKVGVPRSKLARNFEMDRQTFDRWTVESKVPTLRGEFE